MRVVLKLCSPICVTQPPTSWPTSRGPTPARASTAFWTSPRTSTGCRLESAPCRLPTGVRTASTITGVPKAPSAVRRGAVAVPRAVADLPQLGDDRRLGRGVASLVLREAVPGRADRDARDRVVPHLMDLEHERRRGKRGTAELLAQDRHRPAERRDEAVDHELERDVRVVEDVAEGEAAPVERDHHVPVVRRAEPAHERGRREAVRRGGREDAEVRLLELADDLGGQAPGPRHTPT